MWCVSVLPKIALMRGKYRHPTWNAQHNFSPVTVSWNSRLDDIHTSHTRTPAQRANVGWHTPFVLGWCQRGWTLCRVTKAQGVRAGNNTKARKKKSAFARRRGRLTPNVLQCTGLWWERRMRKKIKSPHSVEYSTIHSDGWVCVWRCEGMEYIW